ncbi:MULTISPECIES: hypothetical protein [unclassified Undibacterium]|uniref:hypothetical protein n=1 Tax=unclassified Undibacterium TaxID=2630295 RepID=UPI002AC94DDF|nr:MULTISPECIES: hypothetical protein [unclassified Undibacterium]MEB0140992.1 hypothetical protein [Undibacterium sp. CCC2.1]MEB0174002.1 hypothetical protein [Undibacterium sp. CCC1.1]MEB0177924.1 hypothetical protein [Undibacterium sp. CCC3.4]MEB0217192.1 hypothetical protein [Undibacterium sp. 5I2]WPX42168.1 hypothetical protein RHM61_12220 [Undibacterium sp. CCC3.4]
MPVPTPSAHTNASAPSHSLYRLYALQTRLETLRGVAQADLQAFGFDQLLDDYAAICSGFDALHGINRAIQESGAALAALLALLEQLEPQRLAPGGICALIALLFERHTRSAAELSGLL